MRNEGTKYVFAGSDRRGREGDAPRTRVCPRCGQRLFADMRYCYGCMYDFEAPPLAPDGLGTIELDEIDDLETGVEEVPKAGAKPGAAWASRRVEGGEATPRDAGGGADRPDDALLSGKHHRGQRDVGDQSAQDTLQLAVVPAHGDRQGKSQEVPRGKLALRVSAQAMDLTLPIGAQGVRIGRESDNDLVLHSRLVSRTHALIEEHDGVVTVRDLGATNPVRLRGKELTGSSDLVVGDVVEVCGTSLTLVELPT